MANEIGNDGARACDWLAQRLRGDAPPRWEGPREVVLRARTIVIEIDVGKPIRQSAPQRHHFRLRIAPSEYPAATIHIEADDEQEHVLDVLGVPPSLSREGEG